MTPKQIFLRECRRKRQKTLSWFLDIDSATKRRFNFEESVQKYLMKIERERRFNFEESVQEYLNIRANLRAERQPAPHAC